MSLQNLTRRKFLAIGSVAAGGAALAGYLPGRISLNPDRQAHWPQPTDRMVSTVCEMCFWRCGVQAHLRDGQVTALTGNPAHPLSRGRLCPRGAGGIGNLYDPDRLVKPLIREGERGDERFREAEWDEALDLVADRLQGIADQYGPESLAMFYHGAGGGFFKTLLKALGSPNSAAPSYAQCRGPREVGFELTFGEGLGSPEPLDLAHTHALALIGSHLGENMHNTQVQDFADAVDSGCHLIVVDPRFSVAAGKAEHWLAIRPGTDLALILGWIHLILAEGWEQKAFLAQNAVGLEALRKAVAKYTPEAVFLETGIRSGQLRETARLLAKAAPHALVHPGRHVTWYGDDAQRSRAIAILNALLGNWGQSGGIYLPGQMELKAFPGLPTFPKSKNPADRKAGQYPFAGSVLANGLREATLSGEPYPIKAWLVYGTNLPMVLPNPKQTEEAIHNLDFLVAIDTMPAEITGWADVVLPECTYLERHDDLFAPFYRQPFLALRQPVVDPIGDSKPAWWMAKQLAERMGLGAWFPWQDAEELIEGRLRASGYQDDQIDTLFQKGALSEQETAIYLQDGEDYPFATPSGKIELYSQQLADAGFDPVPVYRRPEMPGQGQFRLLTGRAPVHTFGRTTNNAVLLEHYPENEVWVNPAALRNLGLVNGDRVLLKNQDGAQTGPIRVRATQRIRPDSAFMVHGFGHKARKLRRAVSVGGDDNEVTTRFQVDPLMGGTGMNVNFVTLEKVEV
ncbi:MAG: nitrate reductase [Planctomycetota bacterium]|nr:MAG: nitrate reductase [Planctomycetota bacterium]